MSSTREIAEVLWARCLEAGHKPGRVQFTKYLYLVDYCHWRYHGQQATDARWIFYHYGPWAPEAHAAMNELATEWGFYWAEEEEAVLQFVREEVPHRLSLGLESIVQHIVRAFKDRDLNRVLEFAYNQTEPMLDAKRGDHLDFRTVPVDHSMPLFSPPAVRVQEFRLSPTRAAQLAAMRERRATLRSLGERWQQERNAPAFQAAMQQLAQETAAEIPVDFLRLDLSAAVVDSLSRE
jgi:hypothetical protein